MQPGTLAEEYREHPDAGGKGIVRRGPYFKYQCWHDGRNLSRRMRVTQAAQLRQDIDNAKLFGQLTAQLGQLNIHTLSPCGLPNHPPATKGGTLKKTPRASVPGKVR